MEKTIWQSDDKGVVEVSVVTGNSKISICITTPKVLNAEMKISSRVARKLAMALLEAAEDLDSL